MTGLTYNLLVTLVTLAGDLTSDAAWSLTPRNSDRPSGGKRKGGLVRVGMLLWLHAAQGGICPTCGHALDVQYADLAHVVGSGPKRRGYVAGNIYAAHPSCNVGQAREAWEAGSRDGVYAGTGETRRDYLARLIADGASASDTTAHDAGYRLILTPADFKRPDVIATEWPTDSVGGFIRFDPAYEGKR